MAHFNGQSYLQDRYVGSQHQPSDEYFVTQNSFQGQDRRFNGPVENFGEERGLRVSARFRHKRDVDSIESGSYDRQITPTFGNNNYGYMPDYETDRCQQYGAEQNNIVPYYNDFFDNTSRDRFANNPETEYPLSEKSDDRGVSNEGYRPDGEYEDDDNNYLSIYQRKANDDEIVHKPYLFRRNVRKTQQDDVIFSFDDIEVSRDQFDFQEQNNDNIFDGTQTITRRKIPKMKNSSLENSNEHESSDGLSHVPSMRTRKSKSLKRKRELLMEQRSTHDLAEIYRKEKLEKQMTDTDGNAHWTIKRNKAIQKFKTELKELLNFEIWSNSFKTIEGKFGTAVMSYFRFVKWLLFLNLYVSLVFIGLILLPHLLLNDVPLQSMNVTASCHQNIGNISLSSNTTNVYNGTAVNVYEQAYSCSEKYRDFLYTHRQKEGLSNKVLDFLQGTGWMENTELFYGKYSYFYGYGANRIYNMGLFYLVALGISSILCFLLLVRNSGKGLKQRVLDRNSELTQFANKVLTGWDYCIMDSKAAKMKRISTKLELESDLENQRIRWRKKNRTSLQKWKIIIIRFIVNFVVLSILVGSLYLIYFTNEQLIQLQRAVAEENILQFLVQYLPSVTITLLNIVIPIFFNKIILIENYSPVVEMRMTLTRTVFLRLASLGVLLGTLYGQIHVVDDNETNRNNKQLICGNKKWNANLNSTDEGSIKCWETFVGQQFYKLVLVDFLAAVIPVFIVEFPRRLIFDKFKDRFKIINLIGRPEFDLPKSVLDLVYSQTLCWMGLFFSPLIPAMTVVKCFLLFYIKKLTVLQNYIPPIRPYRTSRSNSLFITVLLFSFTLSVFPVSFMVGNIQPSQSCGPFRVYIICEQNPIDCPSRNPSDQFVFFTMIRNFIYSGIYNWPETLQCVLYFLGTPVFLLILIGILMFVIYYHWIVSVGLQKSEELIKEQLVQEGRDKKFVWMRIIERRSQGHPSVDCE